jgi:hypothetical protein
MGIITVQQSSIKYSRDWLKRHQKLKAYWADGDGDISTTALLLKCMVRFEVSPAMVSILHRMRKHEYCADEYNTELQQLRGFKKIRINQLASIL